MSAPLIDGKIEQTVADNVTQLLAGGAELHACRWLGG